VSRKKTIGAGLALDGEREFKQAISGINKDIAVLNSEMGKVSATFAGSADSMEAARAKAEVYNKQIAAQEEKIKLLKKALENARKEFGESDKRTKDWQISLNKAETALAKTKNEIAKTAEESENYKAAMAEAGNGSKEFSDKSSAAVDTLASALAAAGIAKTIKEITDALKACVSASIEFESALTGVYKTVDGTDEQLQAIADAIKEMALGIPASTTEIAAVAEAAGQLGIATENIMDFTEVMINLGNSTNLSAEEAASALAKFANITEMSADNYDRLGSVIVDLGNNTATTEQDIVNMATRLASTGELVGLTETQIMALSATLSSLGVEAEAGGSALAKLLKQFEVMVATGSGKLGDFAKIANMSADEFATAWEKGPVDALSAFVKGLGNLDKSGGSAVATLEELGLTEVRLSNAVLAMASSGDLLTKNLEIANAAWEENSALATEAGKRYETLESKLQLCGNAASNLKIAIGDVLAPAIENIAELGTDAFTWATEFVENNQWIVAAITGVVASLTVLSGAVVTFTVATKAVIPALKAFGTALAANPVGAVVVGVTAAVAGLTALITVLASAESSATAFREEVEALTESFEENRKAAEEAAKATQDQADHTLGMIAALENLAGKEEKTATDKATILQLVNDLNEAVPSLSLAYDEQADSLNMTAEAMKELAKSMAEAELQRQYIERLSEAYAEQTRITAELEDAKEKLPEVAGKEARAARDVGTAITNLTYAMQDNEAEITALEAAINDLCGAAEEAAPKIDENTNSALEHRKAIAEEAKSIGELTKYLDESRKSTGLSAESVLALTEAGYGAIVQIDAETGAVRLNEAAYIDLMKAKIQEQLNTATEAKRASLQAAVNGEAHAAQLAALGFYDLAKARYAEAQAARDESIEHDANIKALTALQNSVGKYTVAARSSGGVAKSAAEKASTAFKDALKEIDRALELGEIDQEEYWKRYSELMSEHLKEGTEEWADANHKLLLGQRKLSDEMIRESDRMQKEMSDRLQGVVDEYDKALSDIEGKVDDMASRISGIDLVGEKEGVFTFTGLETLEAGNEAIKKLNENLDALDELGISDTLLAEIGKMTTEEANAYSEYLLSMAGTGAWDDYMAAWERRQELALETAQNFYKDQIDTLNAEFTDRLAEELASLSEISKDIGMDVSASLAAGILANQNLIESAMATVAQQIDGFAMPAAAPGTTPTASAPASPSQPLQITITQTLDGREVAKGTYDFIVEEGRIRGVNLIEG
jgi:TP901 family phage tail tape measure protein